jgi:dipeptidyl aminopeptidase/acylaminoacyl peptidase
MSENQSDGSESASFKELGREVHELKNQLNSTKHVLDMILKEIDDVLWYRRVGDIAHIGKYRLTGPPSKHIPNPTAQGAGNPVIFHAYTFIPKYVDASEKLPLMVMPHLGIRSNFNCNYMFPMGNIVHEFLEQGYIMVAPEYRGSTGYGERFVKLIDYGGLEIEDTFAARNWMVENCDRVDSDRVGIVGWSHGGLHTLMNIFHHPDAYKVAYAGVPVSDLIARMGYKTQEYRDLYSAEHHIGKTANENVNEYRRRSPVWNAEKLQTPLLIHTNTADEDVNVLEIEHLIKSLKAAGKDFEYKIYQDAPGGHSFNQIDTKLARESRKEVYEFLARYLSPPNPSTFNT